MFEKIDNNLSYLCQMHSMRQKFGTWFLLMLYCLTITSLIAGTNDFSPEFSISSFTEECKSADSFDQSDHTSQWELQLKSIKEKSEFSGCKKFQEEIDALISSEYILVKKLESIDITNEKETILFSGTDIIFPFHNFW